MKKRFKWIVIFATSILLTCGLVQGQNVKVDSRQAQLLLAASQAVTLQQELDQAGALGFRSLLGTTRGNSELVLLLERDVQKPEKIQSKLIHTNRTGTFQDEINEAARQGFQAVPATFLNKPSGLNEIVVVMERPANASKRYEYKLLATNQTSTLEKEWMSHLSLGYKQIGMITRTEVMLLLEREAK